MMRLSLLLLLVSTLYCSTYSHGASLGYTPLTTRILESERITSATNSSQPYKVVWVTQTLDHFNFFESRKFAQRVLWNEQYWGTKPALANGCKGPIFFYTGNEGDVTGFYDNSGFLTETLATQYGALVVFAEHRYYGLSQPFGNRSLEGTNPGFLSVEQALADYAAIANGIRESQKGAANCPIIAFGGSYGGMLAAWIRLKYPNVFQGALAASAPIVQFYGTGFDPYAFYDIATNTYTNASAQCSQLIKQAFATVQSLGSTTSGRSQLQTIFRPCSPLNSQRDVLSLLAWLISGLTNMAMVDYPYAANFLAPLPAWPVSVACQNAVPSSDPTQQLTSFYNVMSVFYNYTGQAGTCNELTNTAPSLLGSSAWYFQACTQMVLPQSSNPTTSMFPPFNYNITLITEYCQQVWKVTPKPYWANLEWGGFNITAGSQIFFSQGMLDPWRGGGIQQSLSDSLVAAIIDQGAHHLDLRSPNPADPPSVVSVRNQEAEFIGSWISAFVNGGNQK